MLQPSQNIWTLIILHQRHQYICFYFLNSMLFHFDARLEMFCKSNVCWKRHQNSEYGLVTLSCTLYEYLWTGKTYLLTQWIEITLRLFTILSLNYLINPQPLLLILKIRVNQRAGLDWFQEVFDLWYYCSFICCYLLLVQISELY